MKRIIVSVINDLATDQRVQKSCRTLAEQGYEVHLVGRKLKNSLPVGDVPFTWHRMRLLFTRGPLFYAFFNLRLFFYLLFNRADALHANDLDTLLPNFLVAKLRRLPLVYDSHELFTEVPELQGRAAQKIWRKLEGMLFPRLDAVLTVSDSIAREFLQKYGKDVKVMRNLPLRKHERPQALSCPELGLEEKDFVVLLQGAGINIDRGAEEALESMQYLDGVKFLIVGGGDVIPVLKARAEKLKLLDKVLFLPKQDPSRLPSYTAVADLGLSLDKDTNLNYRFSLPNKIFDYVSCGVPVLASKLPEVEKVVLEHQLGLVVSSHEPKQIAEAIEEARKRDLKTSLRESLEIASANLCWENESIILAKIWNERIPHD